MSVVNLTTAKKDQKGQTTRYRVNEVVPAANDNLDFPLELGAYRIQLMIKSNVTGTTTVIQVQPSLDVAFTTFAPSMFQCQSDGTVPTAIPAPPAGAAGRIFRVMPTGGGTVVNGDDPVVVLPYGFRIAISKGGATTGEKLEIDVIVTRVDIINTLNTVNVT